MSEAVLLLVQAAMTGAIAAWMIVGALDNWLKPGINRETVAEVLRMDQLAEAYPELFAQVRERRVTSPRAISALFRLVVIWETLAALVLAFGTVLLLAAVAGWTAPGTARAVSALGASAFTLTWAGFLVGGNWFLYWMCHFYGQFTHFLLAIWGLGVTLLLVSGG